MQVFNIVFERLPMVWFLLGLLFNSLALYIGFEAKMFFVYLVGGWGCCVYGVALYVLQRMDGRKKSNQHRLSPNFISAGSTPAAARPPREEARQAREETVAS